MADFAKKNLYLIFEVAEDATEKEILKAYRKKALKCHPDKNPDNPKAAELFHELSKALEVLTDAAARAAYDKVRRAQKQAAERTKALDSTRKKFKEDLEARESAALFQQQNKTFVDNRTDAEKLQAEIERLQKEGSRILEQEQELMREELRSKVKAEFTEEDEKVTPKLRVKWKARKDDPDNGGYSHEFLHKAFSKYGKVTNLIVSSKKKGSALVEYQFSADAHAASCHEVGLPNNPLTIVFLQGQPPVSQTASSRQEQPHQMPMGYGTAGSDEFELSVIMRMRQAQQAKADTTQDKESGNTLDDLESAVLGRLQQAQKSKPSSTSPSEAPENVLHFPPQQTKPPGSAASSGPRDYESLAEMNARRAAERKRLIEQLQAEDN